MTESQTKICQNCQAQFTIEPDDLAFYKKMDVPAPTFCVQCRDQRRNAVRNERALYQRACDKCGTVVVSRFSPDNPYTMWCKDCWRSDNWDAIEYGRDYDFSKPFFQQFHELMLEVPHPSLLGSNLENSDWVNQETDDKNCYLNVGGHYNEDSAYNTYEFYGKECFDNYWIFRSELCYQNVNCHNGYQIHYSHSCTDCRDTILSHDCHGCDSVFGCAGLRHKRYCIFNKQVTKEEYEQFMAEHWTGSHQQRAELTKKAHAVWNSIPRKPVSILQSTNVSGDNINQSKNAHNAWFADKLEDSKHVYIGGWSKEIYDVSAFGGAELCYEGCSGGAQYNCKFTMYCFGADPLGKKSGSNYQYCYSLDTNKDCFGCVGLRHKQYCILNKQYTQEEYEALVPKIIQHMNDMPYVSKSEIRNSNLETNSKSETRNPKREIEYRYGEFFPIEHAPFAYNETVAMDYFPLSKEQALEQGYPWSDYSADANYQHSGYEVPDSIADVDDDVTEKILTCEVSGKPYKITPMELNFYRSQNCPLPKRSPLQRHEDRMKLTLPRKLFDRQCQCAGSQSDNGVYVNTVEHQHHGTNHCPNTFQTPYAPDRDELIYCQQCYNAEML